MYSIRKQIEENGFIKVDEDIFIFTQEKIIEEQKEWSERDKAKNFDFTTEEYWLITDNKRAEGRAQGFNRISEALLHSGV